MSRKKTCSQQASLLGPLCKPLLVMELPNKILLLLLIKGQERFRPFRVQRSVVNLV